MNEVPERPRANRLAAEKSPYLLQHAGNPVDWFPWGDEAFETARREDKPILLSIGYSTCHWCHVMAEESFQDRQVADFLNADFVSIKVDREERPDIDAFYMEACRAMTGGGGWPLTVFLTPERKPFFAGTYFPRESRYGATGLVELLPRVAALWRDRRADVEHSGSEWAGMIKTSAAARIGAVPGTEVLERAFGQLERAYDSVNGGFGGAPKFPTPHNLTFLMRYHEQTGNKKALDMAVGTLKAMRVGGVYDQIGFGFHRYATDEKWLVPHFEKMAYDQALLADAYLESFQAIRDPEFARTAGEIFAYLIEDMRAPNGLFYAAEDADSEGEEGKYYVWDRTELDTILEKDEIDVAVRVFGLSEPERNIPHLTELVGDDRPKEELARVARIREKLLQGRRRRVRPHRDEKTLTDCNGLIIKALAKGARILDDPALTDAACRAADAILARAHERGGRLVHFPQSGDVPVLVFVDDYAFFIAGLLELYETTFEARWLNEALSLNETMLEAFWDPADGAFFGSAGDGDPLFAGRKEFYDDALPAGNSIAAQNLVRLARLTGRADLEQRARALLAAAPNTLAETPMAYTSLLQTVIVLAGESIEVVIAGDRSDPATRKMIDALREGYHPNLVSLLRDTRGEPEVDKIVGFVHGMDAIDGTPTAYVCRDRACGRPITDPAELVSVLSGVSRAGG